MPKRLPSYRLHKATGQGYTEHQRKAYYFGPYGTPESKAKYARFISQLTSLNQAPSRLPKQGIVALVSELCSAFMDYAERKYRKDGRPTSELNGFRRCVVATTSLYGTVPADEVGPVALESIRQTWLNEDLSRKTVNKYVSRIVRIWKWGVSQQIVPVTAWQALTALESLRKGQWKDPPRVTTVAEDRINPIQPFVSRQIWAMIQFQLWTGCRPQEACHLRMCDVDCSQDIWEYRPGRFKTQHHEDSKRVVYIGPHCQKMLQEWLRPNPDEMLWQPVEGRSAWLKAHKSNQMNRGKFCPGRVYATSTYDRAIERACEKAFQCPEHLRRLYRPRAGEDAEQIKRESAEWRRIHCWSPNQLRHAAATRIRATYGIETARIILGHANAFTTEIYAEQDREKALRAVRESG